MRGNTNISKCILWNTALPTDHNMQKHSGSNLIALVIFLMINFLITLSAEAQSACTGTISGKIIDQETNEPIPVATIRILNSDKGTVSDENGVFTLKNVCGRAVDFEVRFLGYKTIVHRHDFSNKELSGKGHIIYLASDQLELGSVVVEGEALIGDLQSISVKKLDRAALVTKTTQSLASAISDIEGVSFTSVGSNVQLPVIHGLYGNRILIVNNGVKHGFQNWGAEHAPEIDITSANSIAVLKGASGVRYGPEALGGVVVMDGNPLNLSQALYGGISSGYQTNGRGYFANANLGAGGEKFSYHIGGNYRRIGDRSAPDYLLWNTGMEEYSANVGLRYQMPNWNFKAYYSYVDQELGLLRPSVARSINLFSQIVAAPEPILMRDFSYEIDEPKQVTNHHLMNLHVDWTSDIGNFELLVSQQINNRQEFDVRRNAELPIIDLTLNTTDSRLEWYHPTFNGIEGSIGIQFFSQNNDNNPGTSSLPFIPNYNNYRYSLFAIERLESGNNSLEVGLRLDHEEISVRGRTQAQDIFRNDFSYTNITGSLGLVRKLQKNWELRTNMGTAWRTPNMAELYSFGQHGFRIEYGLWRYDRNDEGEIRTDNILTGDDKEVKAEKSVKWTNEISYQKGDERLTITGYANYIGNFIFLRPAGLGSFFWGPGPIYIFDQANAFFVGADLTYSNQLSENIEGTFGASYLYSRNVERDEPLINQPPLNVNAEFAWKTPSFGGLESSKLTLKTIYTFRQFQAPRTITPDELVSGEVQVNLESEIFDFKDAPEGYFLANLLWEWNRGKIGGQVEVRNVFNTSYRDYLNQMRLFSNDLGRNVILTLNYTF